MLVSWNWLNDYVTLGMPIEEFVGRLTMSGLNHAGTRQVGEDMAVDLEVTSNRPDCLGHIGVAREVSVLWRQPLMIPRPQPRESSTLVAGLTSVTLQCPELCSRYIARVIRGVKIGPSPPWLVGRLRTIGIASINNVVDVTNYVLMECGQPLHAFDLARLAERKIVVRRARVGEQLVAIDHRCYSLDEEMCLIADARRPVALGGVMGGAETEISAATTELLIESAAFEPLSIRRTARMLALHSPSSFRFERGVDPEGVDWASRRCVEMILDLAGGELACGSVDVGCRPQERRPIRLRFASLRRWLGIEVPDGQVRRILAALGVCELRCDETGLDAVPPSWRPDLTREADLVEEVARIYGYDKIPEDRRVALVPSRPRDKDRVCSRLRDVLTAAGFNEAMTLSAVEPSWAEIQSPWSTAAPLCCQPPVLKRADRLRQSLIPSLLAVRRTNESLANPWIEIFEMARIYLPHGAGQVEEEEMVAFVSGRDFFFVKGVLETLAQRLAPDWELRVAPIEHELLDPGQSIALLDGQEIVAYVGQVHERGRDRFELKQPVAVAEMKLSPLLRTAQLIRRFAPLSPYPAVTRDLNVIFDEGIHWADVERIVRSQSGPHLERIEYQETYRDRQRTGAGKKSILFSVTLRSRDGTLTREEADAVCHAITAQLHIELGGELRT